jgi:hypothetical protein
MEQGSGRSPRMANRSESAMSLCLTAFVSAHIERSLGKTDSHGQPGDLHGEKSNFASLKLAMTYEADEH